MPQEDNKSQGSQVTTPLIRREKPRYGPERENMDVIVKQLINSLANHIMPRVPRWAYGNVDRTYAEKRKKQYTQGT